MSQSTFKQYYLPEKTGFDSLTLREVPKITPKLGQILVRIKAVSLNWRDGIIALGTYPFPGPDALVPGSDGAGVVEAVGEGVTEWQPGDRVLANFTQDHLAGRLTPQTLLTQLGGEVQGLLGEYFIFPATGVVRIPEYLSFKEASCLPCAAVTAWNALYGLIPLRAGQTVLVQGTGGVSTFALQIAHAAGATTIVTSSSDDKLSKAKQLGATHTINYRTTPDWAAEAKRITGGKGVDHIIEIGGTLTLQASFDAIAMHGIIHCIGHITNPDPLGAGKDLRGPDAAFLALDRLCIVRGVVVGSREQLQEMLECFEAHLVRPVIDRCFNFEEVKQAYAMMAPSQTAKPVRRRNGSKHDKTGCLTCRYRRKKCIHNTFPICGDCRRLNLQCIREPTQVLPVPAYTRADGLPRWPEPRGIETPEYNQRRYAMNFYITTLSHLLTVTETKNCFLSAFLPMAMEAPILREALVAWSAGHLALRDSRYHSVALEARSRALQLLVQSLSAHGIAAAEINAATSLVLMTSEVCLGCHTEWYRHLNGVKNIIMSIQLSGPDYGGAEVHGPEALKQSSEGQWILRNFAYHVIIGSVTLGKKPLLESHFLADLADSLDTYLGVAFGILIIISEISSLDGRSLALEYLQAQSQPRTGHHANTSNFFEDIKEKLQSWACPRRSEPDPALVSLAYAYRASALVYLYRRTLRELRLHDMLSQIHINALISHIQGQLSMILQYISTIPVSGVVESALLFPCFIAGTEVTDREAMDSIRARMHEMSRKRDFSNIQRALGLLEEVWEERDAAKVDVGNYGNDVDWWDIVGRRYGGLLLT
ncbi:hypothetical protein BDV19DRAFT_399492 [Aspergillus venezuelensis]